MTAFMDNIKALVVEKAKEGKVVFLTFEGLMEADVDDILQQPAEGLLYDLNRDRVTCLSFMNTEEDRIWINNFASAVVIERLKFYYDLYMEEHKNDKV